MLRAAVAFTLLVGGNALSFGTPLRPSAPRPVMRTVRAAAPAMSLDLLTDTTTLLASEAGPEELGPVLYAQLSAVVGLLGVGFALDAGVAGEVDEPKEPGAVEGEIDIYRDSPLRFLGYANEVGEAFRPLVPVELVYVSYVLAITYILADTVDKGKKGADAASPGEEFLRGGLGGLDTFFWQLLASVIYPSFCINRLVALLATLQASGNLPDPLMLDFLPTAAGLISIPLIILPLDILAHFTMNSSFRRVKTSVLGAE